MPLVFNHCKAVALGAEDNRSRRGCKVHEKKKLYPVYVVDLLRCYPQKVPLPSLDGRAT